MEIARFAARRGKWKIFRTIDIYLITPYYKSRMRFLKNLRVFVNSPSHSRTVASLIVFAILIAIPLTVIVAQQQQELRQRAASRGVCLSDDILPVCPFDSVEATKIPPCTQENKECKFLDKTDNTYYIYKCQ